MTRIATSAGRYNPWFYAVIGYASLPFSGVAALLAMRVAGVLCCWLMLALACVAARRWAQTAWPFLGIALSCTPVLVYSSSIAAPNGLEMCAGITLWCALLGLLGRDHLRIDTRLVVVATLAGTVLATLRPIGPAWCALVFLTALAATRSDLATLRQMARNARVRIAVAILIASTVVGAAWTIVMRTSHLSTSHMPPITYAAQLRITAEQVPLWLFQSIAAFPYRNEPTAPVVYVAYLVLGMGLLVSALTILRRDRWLSIALIAAIGVAIFFPAVSTLATFEKYGASWQGRYGLPYTVGTLLLLTWALDRGGHQISYRVFVPAFALYVVAQTVSVVATLQRQIASDPLHGTGAWVAPTAPLLGSLAVLGAAITLTGARPFSVKDRHGYALEHSPRALSTRAAADPRSCDSDVFDIEPIH
jgi:hypothetical protein